MPDTQDFFFTPYPRMEVYAYISLVIVKISLEALLDEPLENCKHK